MADMAAEDALNNNDTVKRCTVRLQRKKEKRCFAKCFFKFLKCYKTRLLASTLCVALIMATFCNIKSNRLPRKNTNMTKKHDVELTPTKDEKNINNLQLKVDDIREKQLSLEDKSRLTPRTSEYVRTDVKQNGGYANTKQAIEMTPNALQLSNADKGRVVDYACLYTGPDYELFECPIRIIYSQPPKLITPGITPGHCFTSWGNSDRQLTRSQNIYITAVTMENAPEAVTGDQISVAPRTCAVYGFEDPHKINIDYSIENDTDICYFGTKPGYGFCIR